MVNVGFRAVDGLVVIGSLDERDLIAERRGAFGAGDGFGGGFRASAGDEQFSGRGGFLHGGEDGIGFLAGEHDRFAG